MKVASIVGARPNFIKLAPLFRELDNNFEQIIIHTGQHYNYEMNKIFFEELNIPEPNYHLGVGSGSHGYQVGETVKRTEEVLIKEAPDLSLVYGDTNSTLGGAIASRKAGFKTAHVEAGLRSFDPGMPEEINRIIVDHSSELLFCPTKTAVSNLKAEGVRKNVFKVGDVMVDALKENLKLADERSEILEKLNLKPKSFILATLHRADNTDNFRRLNNIATSFAEISDLVFVCHPRTRKMLKKNNLFELLAKKILVTPPLGYLDMLELEKNSEKILTDSGGIQKEAYLLKVPCITIRNSTEWVETVKLGWNMLVEADKNQILNAVRTFNPKGVTKNIFGRGASKKILQILKILFEDNYNKSRS